LLPIHIVFCKNLQLKMWWWLRFTLRDFLLELWVSCSLNVYVCLEFWGGLLLLLMSWTSHRTLESVRSVEWIWLFRLHVPFQIYHLLQLIRRRPAPPPPPWFKLNAWPMVPIEMLHMEILHSTIPPGNDDDIMCCIILIIVFLYLF